MFIKNLTKKTYLSKDAKFLKTLPEKSIGLLNPNFPRSLIFKTRFGIHTFGLEKPIDVLILDKNKKVVILKQNLKPNHFFFWNPIYDLVLELPQNSIKNSHSKIGDKLIFTQSSI